MGMVSRLSASVTSIALGIVAALSGAAHGQTVRMLGDPIPASATWGWCVNPDTLLVADGTVFFRAEDPVHGQQIWRTSGTPESTRMVLDATGSGLRKPIGSWVSASAGGAPVQLAVHTDEVRELRGADGEPLFAAASARIGDWWYVATTHTGICKLWRSRGDGAALEFTGVSIPSTSTVQMIAANDRLYVVTREGTPWSVWCSDPASGGAVRVSSDAGSLAWITPGRESGAFFVRTGVSAAIDGIYATDGTPAGTRRVLERPPSSSAPLGLMGRDGDKLAYLANPTTSPALHLIDDQGTARLLASVEPVANPVALAGPDAYILSVDRVRKIDEFGTVINLTAAPTTSTQLCWIARMPGPGQGRILFGRARETGYPIPQIWETEGTPESTRLVADFPDLSWMHFDFKAIARDSTGRDRCILSIYPIGIGGIGLASTDGTAEGTVRLSQVRPGHPTPPITEVFHHEGEVYIVQGSPSAGGTMQRFNPRTGAFTTLERPTSETTRLQFVRGRTVWYSTAWRVNSDTADLRIGASPEDLGTAIAPWDPQRIVSADRLSTGVTIDDTLFFRGPAPDGFGGYTGSNATVWKSDGTPAGTAPFTIASPFSAGAFFTHDGAAWCVVTGRENSSRMQHLYRLGDSSLDLVCAFGLETTDPDLLGVLDGRRAVICVRSDTRPQLYGIDLATGVAERLGQNLSASTNVFLRVGESLYYSNGGALTRTDGTLAGTRVIFTNQEFRVGTVGPGPDGADWLYLIGNTAERGEELYRFDVRAEQPQPELIAEIGPGAFGSRPRSFVVAGNPERLCFLANDLEHGFEWWSTDGTEVGTRRLTDVVPGRASIHRPLVNGWTADGRIYFYAHAGESGIRMFELDPNPAPPHCPADFNADSFLDFFDYADFVGCFEGAGCPAGRDADFNNDEFVDFFDYMEFAATFESGC